MRSNHQPCIGMLLKPSGIYLLICRPRTADHHNGKMIRETTPSKALKQGYLAPFASDIGHTVETGVAAYIHIPYPDAGQETAAILVLHKDAGVPSQPITIPCRSLLKEELIGAEYGGNKIGGYLTAIKLFKIIPPEFIFHKNSTLRIYLIKEAAHTLGCVEREIAYTIRKVVVLPHFISRRREESEQDFIFGAFFL